MIFALLWKTLIQDLLEGLSGMLDLISKSLTFNIEEFESRIPGIGIISDIVRIIAFVIIIVNLYHLAMKSILVPFTGNEKEHPVKGLMRIFLSVIGIVLVKDFVRLVFTMLQGTEGTPGIFGLIDGFFSNVPDLGNDPVDLVTAIKNLHGILPTGLFGFIIVFLLFESTVVAIVSYIERYVMTAFYFYLSPIAIACISSSDTSDVFVSWLKGLLGQLFAVVLSVVLIRLYQWKLISLSTLAQIEGSAFIIDYVIAMVLIGLVASGDKLLSMFGIRIPSALDVAGRVGSAAHHLSHAMTLGALSTAFTHAKVGVMDFLSNRRKSASHLAQDFGNAPSAMDLGMKQYAREKYYANMEKEKGEIRTGISTKERMSAQGATSLDSSILKAEAVGAGALIGGKTIANARDIKTNVPSDLKAAYQENFRDAITGVMENTIEDPSMAGKPQRVSIGKMSFDYSVNPGRVVTGDRFDRLMKDPDVSYDSADAIVTSSGMKDFKAMERSYAYKEGSGILFYGTCLPKETTGAFYITDKTYPKGSALASGDIVTEDLTAYLPETMKGSGEHIYQIDDKDGTSLSGEKARQRFLPSNYQDPAVNVHRFENFEYDGDPVEEKAAGLEAQKEGEDNANYIQRIMDAVTRFLMKKEAKE